MIDPLEAVFGRIGGAVNLYPSLVCLCRGRGVACVAEAGLMLSFAVDRAGDGAWFSLTEAEWWRATGIPPADQLKARRRLRALGVWHEEERGSPPALHFRIDPEALAAARRRAYGYPEIQPRSD